MTFLQKTSHMYLNGDDGSTLIGNTGRLDGNLGTDGSGTDGDSGTDGSFLANNADSRASSEKNSRFFRFANWSETGRNSDFSKREASKDSKTPWQTIPGGFMEN